MVDIIFRGAEGEYYYEPNNIDVYSTRGSFPFKDLLPKEVILEKYNV